MDVTDGHHDIVVSEKCSCCMRCHVLHPVWLDSIASWFCDSIVAWSICKVKGWSCNFGSLSFGLLFPSFICLPTYSLYIIPFPEATVHHGLSVLQVPGAMGLDVEDRNQCLVCQRSFLSLTTCLMWKWSFADTLQNVTTVNEVGKTWMQERKERGHRKDGQGQGLRDQGSLKTLYFFFPLE